MCSRRRRGAGSAALAALVLAAFGLGAADASAAYTQLVGTKPVGRDDVRYTYRYGPLFAAPGQNLILVGPVTIEKPAGDGYVTRVQPDLVDASGHAPPIEQVHMHHAVMLNLSRQDTTWPSLPQRFYGFAEEKTIGRLPPPYGYPVRSSDVWAVNYMLHNETPQTKEVWVQYAIDWIPASSARGRVMKPARPAWVDVQNGKAYPVFDVRRGAGAHGTFTYPNQAIPNAYGGGARLNDWRVDRAGTIVAAAGHLHPGGLWTDLDVVRGRRHVRVFRSRAKYFDPNGPVSWDMAMTTAPKSWRVGLRKNDIVRVSVTYDSKRASWYESMGLMLLYVADDRSGPDPFGHHVVTSGSVTHGHLAAADNHGGRPTGLRDPTRLPNGSTVADGVAVGDFTYLPGDLSMSGAAGLPPVAPAGGSLRFGNFDSAGSVFHTITACRAPCNRSTGVSYPIANGHYQFDSGQLGFGPTGYSAASNRLDWSTPTGLPPGTYTYFCRVHPFMRGAFRIPRRG
jgi:plastocyanin